MDRIFQDEGKEEPEKRRKGEEEEDKRREEGMSRKRAIKILGVAENANMEQINRAFRAKMSKVHPDVGGSEEKARELNVARDAIH